MNDYQINTSIALKLGWQYRYSPAREEMRWYSPMSGCDNLLRPPNYCGDLNLMHEAEKHFADEPTARIYVDYLVSLMEPGTFTVMATARQRAEAWLKTYELRQKQPIQLAEED